MVLCQYHGRVLWKVCPSGPCVGGAMRRSPRTIVTSGRIKKEEIGLKKGTLRWLSALTALVVIGSLVLSACSQQQDSGRTASGAVTLEYWDWWVTQGATI